MIPDNLLKGALASLASATAGFYIGGRYVGSLVQAEYVVEKPDWMIQAQETMWISLVLMLCCVVSWLIIDYRGETA